MPFRGAGRWVHDAHTLPPFAIGPSSRASPSKRWKVANEPAANPLDDGAASEKIGVLVELSCALGDQRRAASEAAIKSASSGPCRRARTQRCLCTRPQVGTLEAIGP